MPIIHESGGARRKGSQPEHNAVLMFKEARRDENKVLDVKSYIMN
jgi:hypothetical protein